MASSWCRLPPKIKIWLERSGHDFKPLQVRHRLKTWPSSKPASPTKKKFTTEPILIFGSRLGLLVYVYSNLIEWKSLI